jgi:hypothetical protein
MANKFQVKRTTVSGRTPNTTNSSNSRYIDTGELALNVPDGKLYSSNGTGYFEIGANLQNLSVAANTVINKLVANGSLGQNTQVLASNGTSTYWADAVVGELVLTGTDLVTDVFTGNGTNTQFTLSTTPYDESAVAVIIDGVSQHKSAYSVSGNLIIFSSAPSLDAEVDVTCYTTTSNRLMGIDVTVDTFVGNGSNTNYSLSVTPDSESQILVVIDGVSQHKSAYSVSGYILTFSSAPSVDAEIDVTIFATGPVGAGSNTNVMFNDAGTFEGSNNFVFNKLNNTLSVDSLLLSDRANATSFTIGSSFVANSTGAFHTGTVNAASITTAGVVANATSIAPTSNTILLGNTIGRFVVYANTVTASGLITGVDGANISGTANLVDVNISGNLTVSGTTTYINTTTLNVGDNIVTLNADLGLISPSENAGLEVNRGTLSNVSFLWNETSDSWTSGNTDITGYANATISVNSAALTVGSAFIANASALVITTPVTANGGTGTSGQVLKSNGSTGSPYWDVPGATAGGSDTQIQFNDGGTSLNATAGFTFNKASNTVSISNTLSVSSGFSVNSSQLTVGTPLSANGVTGTSGHALISNGSTGSPYWAAVTTGTVTSVATGNGLTGGPITSTGTIDVVANNGIISNSSGVFANAGTGIVSNATGIHVNTSYVATLDANNAGYLGGTAAASYVQNTDSRTLSGNLVISGTQFTPSSNTTLLGNSTARWVLSANSGDFTGTVSGTVANMSTSVNSAALSVGTDFIANSSQLTVTTPLSANATVGTSGQVLKSNGSTGSPYWGSVTTGTVTSITTGNGLSGGPITSTGTVDVVAGTGIISNTTGVHVNTSYIATLDANNAGYLGGTVAASYVQNTDSRTLSGNLVISGTRFTPASNTILLGNSVSRWILSANTGDFSGTVSGTVADMTTSVNSALLTVGTSFVANTTGAYHTGTVNAASYTINTSYRANTTGIYHTGTVNAASYTINTIYRANTTGIYHTGTVNASSFTTSGLVANSTGIIPTSNSVGSSLGSSTQRWNLDANGATFSANIAMGNNYITGLSAPINNQDAATKAYVDAFQQGLHVHEACHVATTDTLAVITGGSVTYNNGTSGVGATLTLGTALTSLDSHSLVNGDRVLVKNQSNTAHNGIYTWATGGTVLTRATDFDTAIEIAGGDFTFVTNGTLYNSTGWVQTDEVTTIGTDPVAFVQFSGQGLYTAGSYLYLNGSQFNVNAASTSTASVVVARDTDSNFSANTITANLVGGAANLTTSVNSALLTVGTSFIANTTGVYHTGTINAASYTISTNYRANTTGLYHTGTVNAASFTTTALNANTTALTVTGYANVSTSVNSALLTVGTTFIANSTAIVGTGYANVTGSVNASSHTVGTAFIANSTAIVGTGYANVTTSVNSALLTVGSAFIANSTAIVGTGYANVTTSVNSALLTVGTAFIANTTGAYHTGVVNAASYTVGAAFIANSTAIVGTGYANVTGSVNASSLTVGTAFIANSNQLTLTGIPLSGNGTTGTSGQVLTSNGTTGSPYWSTAAGTPAASYVQNTDSRTLSGNLVISGTYFNPSANTVLLGNSISRWVVSANTGDFTGTVTGTVANMSTSVNSALLTVGTAFVANTTGAYHTGIVNAASYRVGSSFIANTTLVMTPQQVVITGGAIEGGQIVIGYGNNLATSLTGQANNTFNLDIVGGNTASTPMFRSFFQHNDGTTTAAFNVANTGRMHVGSLTEQTDSTFKVNGTANVTTSVNSALLTVGTAFIANTTALVMTTPVTANGTTGTSGFVLKSNGSVGSPYWAAAAGGSVGGTDTQVQFNDGGSTTNGTAGFTFTKTTNNVTIANTLTVGSSFIANSTAIVGTGYANVTGSVNASSHTVGTAFIANSTAIVSTGFANIATSVNSALLTVGTAFIANTTGMYHGGVINAASISVGSGSFVANTTHIVMSDPLTANGATGTARNVLASNGSVGSPYWVDFNTEVVYALSGTALDPLNGTIQTKTIAATTTFTDSLTAGQSMVLMLNGGSSYSVIFPTMTWVTTAGNVAPTLTANVALTFWKISTTLYGSYVGSYT